MAKRRMRLQASSHEWRRSCDVSEFEMNLENFRTSMPHTHSESLFTPLQPLQPLANKVEPDAELQHRSV
jgi:hypothetical protein